MYGNIGTKMYLFKII